MATTGSGVSHHRATRRPTGGHHRTAPPRGAPGHAADRRTPSRAAPNRSPAEPIGSLLARLRANRGWSQPYLADRLCHAAGVATVSRNEVSRWERQLRVPGLFWLGWLAEVLDVPLDRLMAARRISARHPRGGGRCDGRHDRGATTVGA